MTERVQLVDPQNGSIYSIDADQSDAAQRQLGYVPATAEQVQAYLNKKPGEEAGQGMAFVRGAASALLAPAQKFAEAVSSSRPDLIQPGLVEAQKPFYREVAQSKAAFPLTTAAGQALPQVGLGIATGGAGLGGVALETGVGALQQEATDAAVEDRPMTADGILYNGALSLGFLGLGHGLGALTRKVMGGATPLVEAASSGARKAVPRALADESSDLANPFIAAEAKGTLSVEAEHAASQIDSVLDEIRPPVANNGNAQRTALEQLTESAEPEIAERLQALKGAGRRNLFQGLHELADETGDESILAVANDPALWGQKAVDVTDAIKSAKAARGTSLQGYADALRTLDDPAINRHLADLDDALEQGSKVESHQAFGSVGARAADDVEKLTEQQISGLLDPKLDDDLLKSALGTGNGVKTGAVDRAFDGWRKVVNNAEKHRDFATGLPDDPVLRSNLRAVQKEQASTLRGLAEALKTEGASTPRINQVTNLAEALESDMKLSDVPKYLDKAKQTLDDIHMFSWQLQDKIKAENLQALVDEPANDLRAILEDPSLMGSRNAELQAGRNAAWSGEGGFIRNNNRLEAHGIKLFKKIDRDFNTGELLLEPDVGAIKRLVSMDDHEFAPVAEPAAAMLDSMENMLRNTVESGAASAASKDIVGAQAAIQEVREIFQVLDMRHTARRMTQGGVAGQISNVLSAAENIPVVGNVIKGSRKAGVLENVERQGKAAVATRTYKPEPAGAASGRLRKLLAGGGTLGAGAAVLGATDDASAAEQIQAQYEQDISSTARALSDPDYATRYTKRMKGSPTTLEAFQGPHADMASAYVEARQRVEEMARNPEALSDQLAGAFGDLPPDIQAQAAAKAFAVSQYLTSKLPPVRGQSVTRPQGLPPAPLEIRTFALQYMAAVQPETVLDDGKRGRLRHEQVDTLKALWSPTYDDLRIQTLLSMGNGRASANQKIRADLLFGYGEELDGAFSRRLSTAAQAAYEEQQKGSKAPSPSSVTKIPAVMQPSGLAGPQAR